MRRTLVAGNWKMHGSLRASRDLLGALRADVRPDRCDVVLCPPFPYLALGAEMLAASPLVLGAQDMHFAAEGAYTGEVSAAMLLDFGCSHVIVGHSERRQYCGESDEAVALKAEAALRAGMVPIVCVGELQSERDAGQAFAVVERQLAALVARLDAADMIRAVVAYEPVWAIGTGRTATPQQAQEMHLFVREILRSRNPGLADAMRVIYGGSVKAGNAGELFAQPDIDGALVGGAALDASEFAAICRAAEGM